MIGLLRTRAVRLAALAIASPILAAAALVSTANAQEPQTDSCLLSELVLIGSAPGAGTQDAAVTDVAFPGDVCMFLQSSFTNTFDLGTFNPGSGIEAPEAAARGQNAGGCDLIEVVGAVVTETPALADAMGPVPEVSLSEHACDTLLTAYGLLATGRLTPLSAPAEPIIVPASGRPPAAPLDQPLGMETGAEPATDAGMEAGESTGETIDFTAGCNVNDLIDDFIAQAPALALPDDGANDDEAPVDEPSGDGASPDETQDDASPDDGTSGGGDAPSDASADDATTGDDASSEDGSPSDDEALGETPDDELSGEGCESLASVFRRAAALINGEPTDEPVTDEPVTDEPATDGPTTDGPATDEPATDEPATDEPVTDEPATDEPVTDEPVTDEPATDEPVTDEPATDEPAAPGPEGGPLTVDPAP